MIWQELTKTALLGTEHSTLPPHVLSTLEKMGIDLEREAPLILADAIAMYSQLRKAGFQLHEFQGELPLPEIDSSEKQCSVESIQDLDLILNGIFENVLPEFLSHLSLAKKNFPVEYLPALLSRNDGKELFKLIKPNIGNSGFWLIAQHPVWKNWIENSKDSDWRTGSKRERLSMLRNYREKDPTKVIEVLKSTWQEEDFGLKVDFIAELAIGLSMSDEPFLESCLDEPRKEVRQAAIQLLSRLQDSQFNQRMYKRASVCFSYEKGELLINPKWKLDKTEARDGLYLTQSLSKSASQVAYLQQVVSLVPPKRWNQYFNQTPAQIIPAFSNTDWSGAMISGLYNAVALHKDSDWANALLRAELRSEKSTIWQIENFPELINLCSPEHFSSLCLLQLENATSLPYSSATLFKCLELYNQQWNDNLTMRLVSLFQDWLSKTHHSPWQTEHIDRILHFIACHCRPGLIDEIQKRWDTSAPVRDKWNLPVNKMLETILFRKEMIAEFSG